MTRLRTQGTVTLAGSQVEVAGSSWFDHEWSTSALGAQAIGWDWFSLQMDDGTELMLFQIRRTDGALEPVSSGTLVEADGTLAPLTATEFTIEVSNTWRSPETGATYPSAWVVRVPALALELSVRPILDDQEMRVSFPYWEGAVTLDGTRQGRPLKGRGFVELTGYARSMQGVF
jgi:predicted secreted hydrolase